MGFISYFNYHLSSTASSVEHNYEKNFMRFFDDSILFCIVNIILCKSTLFAVLYTLILLCPRSNYVSQYEV